MTAGPGLVIRGVGSTRPVRLEPAADLSWLDPRLAARNPVLTSQIRLSVLLRCYHNDYHADVFDEEGISRRISSGRERVLFWGDPSDIALVRTLAETGRSTDRPELDALRLGTQTALRADEWYGDGHIEVARTGSVHPRTEGAAAAIMWDLGEILAGATDLGPFHTISFVPRNRTSTATVPGGAAIHRLHTRIIGSRHWGLAPWHVLAGSLEMLDYRELTVVPHAVEQGFATMGALYVPYDDGARMVTKLCALNGYEVAVASAPGPKPRPPVTGPEWRGPHGHGPRLVNNPDCRTNEFETPSLAPQGEASLVAYCNLEDEAAAGVQETVVASGFRLTMISPPKVLNAEGIQRRVPLRGIYCRPATGIPIAAPYYLDSRALDPDERSLVDEYQLLVQAWQGADD